MIIVIYVEITFIQIQIHRIFNFEKPRMTLWDAPRSTRLWWTQRIKWTFRVLDMDEVEGDCQPD
jgi:hypothetical protein